MAQTTGRRQSTGSGRTEYGRSGSRSAYIAGNTARRLDVITEIQQPEKKRKPNTVVQKNRDRAVYMNLGYVLFLTASLLVAGVILIGYIRLQSDITASVKRIAVMESSLNSLKVSNDEEYSRIESSIDLEEIRRIAITELGMTYPNESQIVIVPDEGSDYVRQLVDIGE